MTGPERHFPGSRRHRAGCRECRDKRNAYTRAWRLATGKTAAPRGARAAREDLSARGELYGDDLYRAVYRHLLAHPVAGLTAYDIARALRTQSPGGGGQIRVRHQLARLEAAGNAGWREELRGDGSGRTCHRWYPSAVLRAGLLDDAGAQRRGAA